MPLFHIHGLVGALLSSLAAGGSVICAPGFQAPKFFSWLDEFRPTWYTAAPALHRAVMDRSAANREIIARAPLRFIRSCSAPLPAALAERLEETFDAPVVDSYGMTEAAHQIASTPLGRRKPGSVGVAAGPEIAIIDEAGDRLPAGASGEIVIRGANVMRGYDGADDTHPQPFIDGWLRTGDLGYLDADGHLFITGRLKEIINRGGEKISPAEVEAALLSHPAVMQAAVFAAPHLQLGEEVAAAVVLRDGAGASAGELRRFAAGRLADFKVPARVVFVAAIPTGPTGKVERLTMAERLGLGAAAAGERAEYIPPRTPLENYLAELWREILAVPQVGVHDNFFARGGDSILAAQIIARVRAFLQIELSFLVFLEAPTVAGIAGALENAPPPVPPPERIVPSSRREPSPLSYGQERMWFLNQLEPGNPAYNRPACYRFEGPLDPGALQQALGEIVERHEVLRTTFAPAPEGPLQVVASGEAVALGLIDLEDLPEAERRQEAERLAAVEMQQPFDLARGPLLRATLIVLSEAEHMLVMVTHHIVFDGWSEAIFLRELTTLYGALVRGAPAPLAPLAIQYVDYTLWQRRRLRGKIFADQLSYWKKQLADVALLDLPTDRPRPAAQTFRGAKKTATFSPALSDEIKALGRRAGATLFMTLLAAFQTLLHRYTGQDDIVLGTPIAGRNPPEVEGLIGLFINTLVLRGDLSGDPSFTELLARTRKTAVEAYERQDLPFEKLVEELRPHRDPSRAPLFQVMFVLENTPRANFELAGLTATPVEIDSGTAKLDLTLSMEEAPGALKAVVEYNTDLFERDTIERMLGHFETLLRGIVENPDRPLSELPILSAAERRRLRVEWNDTQRDYPQDKCIHELFEAQADRTPDAVAVVFDGESLTYSELNRRANRLAHQLQKLGIGPEALVGICVERSLEMAIGMLGVLKAGGAYVPLDPSYPRERLRFMLSDADMKIVLTQQALSENFAGHGLRVVNLDVGSEGILRGTEENPVSTVTPDSLAYVIYTSGSTGRPKGVMVCHRSVCNHLFWRRAHFPLTAQDRSLQSASISFDDSVWEFFEPLMCGARVVIARHQEPVYLARLIADEKITSMCLVPSMLEVFLEEPEVERCHSLLRVSTGGETLSVALQDRFFARFDAELHNGYGPTEATIAATFWTCKRRSDSMIVPIGPPIANTQVYILDRYLQPVPIGMRGELHIGGLGLARGYLNSPELTAEKFIPHPFSEEPGARLYKTGDLARYQPDGNIEFLGRQDNQVKIRGFRVELGEIEAVLGQHPAVRDVIVVAREDGTTLLAYVVAQDAQAPATNDLRAFLKARLPDYMIPSSFVFLKSLPLTPNGKVDRRALPAPAPTRPELRNPFVAPRSPVEETLARIWADVLGLERVGVDDNFFDLGGHSLLATQVISRARAPFQIELSLRSFFETPTVAAIAAIVQQAGSIAESPLRKISRARPEVRLPAKTERPRIGVERSRTERDDPAPSCLHELFEARVERTPDAPAVVFEERRLTYGELNGRANQLAHYLKKLGVGPEVLVGICVERSVEMVVGILGILKAGGAYVPMNPAYPRERLAFMLAQTQARLLLTQQRLRENFAGFSGRTLCLDDHGFEAEPDDNPRRSAGPDNLAYVMYTSGSTGKPKGVLTCHRGVINYLLYLRETYDLGGADTVLQLPPLSFDASVRDLIGPLAAGARIVIVSELDAKAPAALLAKIAEHRVTCLLSLVPTMMNTILDAAASAPGFDSTRLILASGEALSMSSCRKAQEIFGPNVRMVNQYGPTETTMTCSYHRIVEADDERSIAPLGKAIPNARMYIMDDDKNPVALGVPGELHIGGIGVARGYLNAPELTAEKFIADPFSDEPGARLYKTGDRARALPDGAIEFLGRLDHQVKIRGFRVEPEEIEAVLAQHAGVRAAAVVAREDLAIRLRGGAENPGTALVAYVVANAPGASAASELREFLNAWLPDYMIPSSFVFVKSLPLTPHGKVDRRALPAPDRLRPELKSPFVAPRSPIEETLAAIWTQVLGLDRVGVNDNFFDLGGHSLLATQVISRVRKTCEVELSLRGFFAAPTVAGIAAAIERAKESGADSPPPKISRVPR
jgi:amino acid adenylation domain-containing protein